MKVYLLVKILNPILQLIFFTLLAKFVYQTDDVTPWVIGNAFLLSVYNSVFGVGAVMISERGFGTLKLVIGSTANKFFVFTGRAFIHIFDGLFSVIIGFLVGYFVFNLDFSNTDFLVLAMCLIISMFAAMGLGLFIGSFGLVVSDVNLILNLSMFILILFSGAQFSIDKLPSFLQFIPDVLPITRGIEASRLIIAGQIDSQVFELIGMEFVVGIVYIVLGYLLLKLFENLSKRYATLDIY